MSRNWIPTWPDPQVSKTSLVIRQFGACLRGLLLIAPLLMAAPGQAQLQAVGDPPALSRFQRTVLSLRESSPDDQAGFATQALGQLAEVYMAEADLARTQARGEQGKQAARLRGWSMAVDQYASQLMLVLDDVAQGYPVELLANREGSVSITVAGRAVILGHPRPGQQAAYEQQVLTDFCARYDCVGLTAGLLVGEAVQPIPMTANPVSPRWTFTGTGPVCSNEGVTVRFDSTRQLAALRELCAQLMQELATLATELAWQGRHGVVVDWNELAITATPGRTGHLLRLNAPGDSILVTVPLLYGSPGLLDDIQPWLRARAAGERAPALELDAANYGWSPSAQ